MTRGTATLVFAAVIATAAASGILTGCGRRASMPATPQPPTGRPSSAVDLDSQTVVQQEKRRPGEPAKDASDEGRDEATPEQSGKPTKPKLTDEQYVDLMVELAVITNRLAQQKISEEQFVPELEKVCRKYGVTLDDLDKEKDAHQLSEEQNAEFARRLSEELKRSTGAKQ